MRLPIGGCERSIRRAAQFTAAASATSAAVEPSAIRVLRLAQRPPSIWDCPGSWDPPRSDAPPARAFAISSFFTIDISSRPDSEQVGLKAIRPIPSTYSDQQWLERQVIGKQPVYRTAKRSAVYPLLLFVGHVCMLLNLFFALPDFISERLHIHFRFLRFGKNLLFLLSDVMVHVLTKNGEFRVIQFFVGCHLLQLANELL